MIARALACLALAALAFAQDGGLAGGDPQVDIDLDRYYSSKRLQLTLAQVAAKFPEIVRVESLGKSAGGIDLNLVTLARLEATDPRDRPALLVVGGFGVEDLFGMELALATIRQIVLDSERDPLVAEVLSKSVIYVVPCLDPDLREQVFAAVAAGESRIAGRAIELDRNFPTDWDPLRVAGAGPYPLSEPESRALAEFLLLRPNIAVCQRYSSRRVQAAREAGGWPRSDRECESALAAESQIEGLDALDGPGGSWMRFAYCERGAFVFSAPFSFDRGGVWALPQLYEIPQLGRTAALTTLRLARSLPHLELSAPRVELLGADQWTVDVDLSNTGRLPTTSAMGRSRSACEPPSIEVDGARLVGAALVQGGDCTPIATRGARVLLADVDGGVTLHLRLFLGAAAGTTVHVDAAAPRAGRSRATLTLQ